MGQIGSTEMYLIWDKFGITEMYSGLIDITGSSGTNSTNTSLLLKECAKAISIGFCKF